ncbi:hypothetical protein H7097_00285 [Aeromicrobium sp.]|nr:hypothetical protein [Candidatus Saccharibacteria bacterium]
MAIENPQNRELEIPLSLEAQAMLVIEREDVLDMLVPNFEGVTGRNFLEGYPEAAASHRTNTERKLRVLVAMTPDSKGYDILKQHVADYINGIFGVKQN